MTRPRVCNFSFGVCRARVNFDSIRRQRYLVMIWTRGTYVRHQLRMRGSREQRCNCIQPACDNMLSWPRKGVEIRQRISLYSLFGHGNGVRGDTWCMMDTHISTVAIWLKELISRHPPSCLLQQMDMQRLGGRSVGRARSLKGSSWKPVVDIDQNEMVHMMYVLTLTPLTIMTSMTDTEPN